MKTIDLIRGAMQMADKVTGRLADDMRDAPLMRPTSGGGNHPLWLLGHLAVVEGAIPQIAFGEPNPVGQWEKLFGQGTTPSDDAAAYPPYEEVLGTYRDLRRKNVARLEELGEAGLDAAPVAVPPGFEDEMRTVGQTYLTIAMHQMIHYGQLADARRAAGRQPFI
jgi:DinB superfamily